MRFFYVSLRTCAQYASMNEFTRSEHSVRIRIRKKNTSLENSLKSPMLRTCVNFVNRNSCRQYAESYSLFDRRRKSRNQKLKILHQWSRTRRNSSPALCISCLIGSYCSDCYLLTLLSLH